MKPAGSTGTPRSRRRSRLTASGPTIGLGALLWVWLWGDLSWANVLSGAALGALVALAFPLPTLRTAAAVRPVRVLRLFGRFATDLVLASFQVAWSAVRPGPTPRGGLVTVRLRSTSDLFVATTAGLSSLVPGTLVIDLDGAGRTLSVHVLDLAGAGGPEAVRDATLALEERLLLAFASRAELDRTGLARRLERPHDRVHREETR